MYSVWECDWILLLLLHGEGCRDVVWLKTWTEQNLEVQHTPDLFTQSTPKFKVPPSPKLALSPYPLEMKVPSLVLSQWPPPCNDNMSGYKQGMAAVLIPQQLYMHFSKRYNSLLLTTISCQGDRTLIMQMTMAPIIWMMMASGPPGRYADDDEGKKWAVMPIPKNCMFVSFLI